MGVAILMFSVFGGAWLGGGVGKALLAAVGPGVVKASEFGCLIGAADGVVCRLWRAGAALADCRRLQM